MTAGMNFYHVTLC